MTRDDIIEILMKHNPEELRGDVSMYADAFATYQEANENIERNGAIVFHPKTGAPIDNPYLRVRELSKNSMRAIKSVRGTHSIWRDGTEHGTRVQKEGQGEEGKEGIG